MRKRKWQTAFFILLIVALSVVYIYINELHFTKEDAFYACERGLRHPPSKEIIMEFDREDGAKVLVGRQEDGLFVVPVKKSHFFLWRMAGGGIDGYEPMDELLDGYLTYDGNFLGLCQDENIAEVSMIIGRIEELNWTEVTFPVKEGLIFIEASELFQGEAMDPTRDYVLYIEGKNKSGEVLYWDGDEDVAEYVRKGNIRSSRIKSTVERE